MLQRCSQPELNLLPCQDTSNMVLDLLSALDLVGDSLITRREQCPQTQQKQTGCSFLSLAQNRAVPYLALFQPLLTGHNLLFRCYPWQKQAKAPGGFPILKGPLSLAALLSTQGNILSLHEDNILQNHIFFPSPDHLHSPASNNPQPSLTSLTIYPKFPEGHHSPSHSREHFHTNKGI